MSATVYADFDSSAGTVANDVRTRILAQGDWADISPALTTTLATFGAASVVGATGFTISSTATAAAGMSVGDVIVVDKGLATEERFRISARSGTTTFNVADPAMYAHANGAVIQSGRMLLKATTTRGAQMVVDLTDGGSTLYRMGLAVYRTHDGTTGVDKLQRWVNWKFTSGSVATDPLHVNLSVGKEHFYLSIEGPRPGESGADSTTYGSGRNVFALCDVVPYFDTDTVPAVCLVGSQVNNVQNSEALCWVSRNQGNTASWVTAKLGTISYPAYPATNPASTSVPVPGTFAQIAKADNNWYFFPFVVVEQVDGLRGRLAAFYDAGYNLATVAGEPAFTAGQRYTVGGASFVTTYHSKAINSSGFQPLINPFGSHVQTGAMSVILVPA